MKIIQVNSKLCIHNYPQRVKEFLEACCDAGVDKGPQLNSLCLSSSKNLTGQAGIRCQGSPINRDPPKADKSPPYGIGGQVRFAPTGVGEVLFNSDRTNLWMDTN